MRWKFTCKMYTSQGVLPIKAYLKYISKELLFNLKEKMNLVFFLFNGSGEKRVKIFTEPTLKIINKNNRFSCWVTGVYARSWMLRWICTNLTIKALEWRQLTKVSFWLTLNMFSTFNMLIYCFGFWTCIPFRERQYDVFIFIHRGFI